MHVRSGVKSLRVCPCQQPILPPARRTFSGLKCRQRLHCARRLRRPRRQRPRSALSADDRIGTARGGSGRPSYVTAAGSWQQRAQRAGRVDDCSAAAALQRSAPWRGVRLGDGGGRARGNACGSTWPHTGNVSAACGSLRRPRRQRLRCTRCARAAQRRRRPRRTQSAGNRSTSLMRARCEHAA
jgi:hypothetical protein